MDPAGFAIGVVGLTGQLAKAAMDCYRIFDNMNDVGSAYDGILHDLRTQGLLLKGWEQAWGFGSDSHQQQRLDPGDYRYRYATASLARIVAVFVSVDKLHAKYGVAAKKESTTMGPGGGQRKARWRDRLSVSLPLRSRSKSPVPSPGPSTSTTQIPIPGATQNDLHLLENPQLLENKHILPGLDDEITSMTHAIDRVQQSLPIYLKLRWAISDNAKLVELLKKLTSLNDGLFRVLPASEISPALPANSPEDSLLKPSFDIPFCLNIRKNADFVGREYLLENLKREIGEGEGKGVLNIIVLYGTGGMGKTQLALEYVYQHYQGYSSVFWVNVASVQTTILGFTQIMQQLIEHHLRRSENVAKIGRLLGMTGKLDSSGCFVVTSESEAQHVVDAVKRWFSAPEHTNWLLVFDNLDDLDLVDIEEYIPSCNRGTVIITSRRRESLQQGRRGFEVQQMHPTEAIQLLLRACKIPKLEDLVPIEQAAARTITQELGYLPLALSQAGAYIHISQYSLSRYLKEYPNNASYLLGKRWTGGKHDRSVFATWEISFKAIEEKSPEAGRLLLVCAFFDHDDIPEELLQRGLNLEKDGMNLSDLSLKESIRTLFSYSLVKRGSRDDSFSIHPLVHSWARLRLMSEPDREIEGIKEGFGIIVAGFHKSDSKPQTEDWIFEQQVMTHIDAVAKHSIQYHTMGRLNLGCYRMYELAQLYMRHGRYGEALEWYTVVLAEEEKEFGVDHPDTLTTIYGMALVFDKKGQYDTALEWYGRALAGEEKALGSDHPSTLATVHCMASVFHKQGQYDKALEWNGRALAGDEKALGVDHPNTLATVHNMASVFVEQGQYDKALEWYGRALSGRENVLGLDHPETLTTVHGMASVFNTQGQYDKALECTWYGRALSSCEQVLGVDHPDTLAILHGMASVFHKQGQYDKALEWYGRALAGEEKALGVDHPETLSTVHGMASVFVGQGQYDKALEWYGRALAGEKALGADHPNTLATVHNMASVFVEQGQYDKALEWYGRALAGREQALGSDHPNTLSTVHGMAKVFDKQGQHDTALEWYGRALAGQEKALGVDHPDTLATVHGMASVFEQQGQYDRALEWYGRALAGKEKALGSDHTSTLTTVYGMASVFDKQGQYDKALEWYGRALAGREQALRSDHPNTLATIHGMASVFDKQGQYDTALEWYGRALSGQEKALGVDHPDTLVTIHGMALVFDKQGQYDMALEWCGRAFAGQEKVIGTNHPSTQLTIRRLIDLHEKTGHTEQAQSLRASLCVPTTPPIN